MLGRLGWWRHAAVAVAVAVCALLTALGFIGGGGERFDAKQIVVEPVGDDGLQITEIVDIDFASKSKHGYERNVDNDFGVPIDVSATSADAPDDVSVNQVDGRTQIRIGRSDTTVSGQHRYVLRYTLPAARLSTGQLALDGIGNEEKVQTGRFEVIVTGLQLDGPLCNVGSRGSSGGCTLVQDGDVYRAVIAPLDKGDGVTIGGTIVGRAPPADVVVNALPQRRNRATVPLTVGIVAIGATGAAAIYGSSRRRGRNEVFGGGGAADAAFGALPRPGAPVPVGMSTTLVADDQLASLATIEFVPPPGIAPWQGSVLLNERLGNDVVAAWFSGQAAADVIELEQSDKKLVVRPGAKRAAADAPTAAIIDTMLNGRDELTLGTYDKHFASAWNQVTGMQRTSIAESGWWKRLPPSSSSGSGGSLVIVVVIGLVVFGGGSLLTAAAGLLHSVPLALLFGLVVPSVVASAVYHTMLPARSGTGSAMALRTESFRRFLVASEGKHVEWAWKQGLLREYSAWAVSLGAADAWGKALAASNIPPAVVSTNSPMLVYAMGSSLNSSHTAPSSSGSGGSGFSGGFSGGSVGGGGGGGSSGSW
jgi:hypothetical protein